MANCRWHDCLSSVLELSRKLPVALLPMAYYPKHISGKINRLQKAIYLINTWLNASKQPRTGAPNTQQSFLKLRGGSSAQDQFAQDQPEYMIGKVDELGRLKGTIVDENAQDQLKNAMMDLLADQYWVGKGEKEILWQEGSDIEQDETLSQKEKDRILHVESQTNSQIASGARSAENDEGGISDTTTQEPSWRDQQSSQKDPGKDLEFNTQALSEEHPLMNSRRAKLHLRRRNRSRSLENL